MTRRFASLALLSAALLPTIARAQTTTPAPTSPAISHTDSGAVRGEPSDPERRAQLARRGGGLRVGAWSVSPALSTGAGTSTTPSLEGYVRKGLDLHLALENSIGFWRHAGPSSSGGGILGGSSSSAVDDYIIPQFTSLLFYPFTKPQQRVEPYLRGGLGLTLGVEDQQSGNGMSFVPGIGVTGGAGIEMRPTDALGLEISGRYQGVRFFQDFAGQRSIQGPVVEIGATYRFQFR